MPLYQNYLDRPARADRRSASSAWPRNPTRRRKAALQTQLRVAENNVAAQERAQAHAAERDTDGRR